METETTEPWKLVDALDGGRGSVDRSAERKLEVRGPDARRWLGDLVTADVATLEPGSSRRSLLLTPTGRIRADLWIGRIGDDVFLVLQAKDQPEPVDDVLRPYVLSSAVRLEDVSNDLSVVLFPGPEEIVTAPIGGVPEMERELASRGAFVVDERSYEIWRIGRGDPRMGTDFEAGALPAEAGLERLIDLTKGCFLGQESVAKVRNLGHPPSVLRHLRSATAVEPGTPVLSEDGAVGQVTSVAPDRRGGFVLISRVEWRAAGSALHSGEDSPMFPIQD